MIYNVAQLLRRASGASRQLPISGTLVDVDENNPGHTPVRGTVLLLRTTSGILATGEADFELVLVCRRCLELVKEQVTVSFEEEFVPSVDLQTGRPLETSEVSPELVITDEHLLDLTEVLRQYAVMEAVQGTLCSSDCRGLCPVCGQNLNERDCGCDRRSVDPRMAPLLELLSEDQEADGPVLP
jgi:uncharacterized protein